MKTNKTSINLIKVLFLTILSLSFFQTTFANDKLEDAKEKFEEKKQEIVEKVKS